MSPIACHSLSPYVNKQVPTVWRLSLIYLPCFVFFNTFWYLSGQEQDTRLDEWPTFPPLIIWTCPSQREQIGQCMEMTCYNNYNNDRHTFEIYQRERTCLKSFHWFVISGEANHDHTKTIRMLTVIWSYISKCYNNNNTSMTSVICPFLLPFSCMTVYVYS